MKTLVIGDIHGCGLELQQLITKAGMEIGTDQIILVGDLFDRAKHAHVVWEVIQEWGDRIYCLMGNHEKKMLSYLRGKRPDLPKHYFWAMNDLERAGVSKGALIAFLEAMPTILVWRPYANGMGGKVCGADKMDVDAGPMPSDVIIAHAGININCPLNSDPSFTVYGDVKKQGDEWWERYKGTNLVLYGHLSERDMKPRIRRHAGDWDDQRLVSYDPAKQPINSIGLDTACAHGGYLTGYVIETGELISVAAQKDWTTELKHEMREIDEGEEAYKGHQAFRK